MAACALALAVGSLLIAFRLLPGLHRFFFVWDHNFGPAVSYACGRPFADVAHPPVDLVDFLNRRRPDFACGGLPRDAEFVPINAYANGIPYFLRGLGLYWRWRGVAWPNLAPLFATLFAVSNVLVFLVFRQFLGDAWGFATALVYACSPGNYFAATYYEHFTKIPIFLGVLLIIVSLVRVPAVSTGRLLAMAVTAGLLLGVGFGIRADLWLLIVPTAAAVLWFCGAKHRPPLSRRLAACAVLLAVTVAVALPAATTGGRSYFWLQLVEGLSTDFDADLSVRPGAYEWVPAYSDELGASWMQAHDRRGGPDPALDWQQQERAGRAAYFAVMRYFPADFITRPLAAAIKVTVDSLRSQPAFAVQFSPAAPNFFTRTASFWAALARLSLWPVFLLPAALFVLALRDGRQALFLFLLALYLGGATAIAFLPRHRWHLYFIGFLTLAVAMKFIVDLIRRRSVPTIAPAAIRGTVVLVGAGVALVVVTRAYQDRVVASLMANVLAAPRAPLAVEWHAEPSGGGEAVAADFVRNFMEYADGKPRVERAEYLAATFSREGCGDATTARIRYRASQPSYDHSSSVALDFADDSRTLTYAFPAYATKFGSAYGFFEGIAVPTRECLMAVARIADRAALPLQITWHMPERWREQPRHQTIVFPPVTH